MKVIVNRTGKFLLVEPETRMVIDRPVLVRETEFVRQRVFSRELEPLTNYRFPDEASNEEFQDYVKESKGDLALAVSAFQSKFDQPVEVKVEKTTAATDAPPSTPIGADQPFTPPPPPRASGPSRKPSNK